MKAAFAKISVVLSFHNEDQSHLSDPEGDQVNIHYLGAECKDISLCLQVINVLGEYSSLFHVLLFLLNTCCFGMIFLYTHLKHSIR